MMKPKRVALYVRVSTDGQTTTNQLNELEAVARRHGWEVMEVFKDQGISGAKGRDQRPGFNKLLTGLARKDFDMIAAWSVDRLSRSLQDLVGFLSELRAKGVDLYLHQQGLDTSTPAGRAMFGMLSVFSEFERSMIQERVRAGLNRARKEGKRLGRPPVDQKLARQITAARAAGHSVREVAAHHGVSVGLVHKLTA
jgi:DNA invertase Pin-like site-specific DNA recombinase